MRIKGLGGGGGVAALIPPLVLHTTAPARAAASFWPVQPRQGEGALIFRPSALPVRTRSLESDLFISSTLSA